MATTCKANVLSYPKNQSLRVSPNFHKIKTNEKFNNTVLRSREEHFETEILIWPDDMRLVTP